MTQHNTENRGRKRLTPDERERIIELRLNRATVRQIAATVGCAPNTVQKVYKTFLAQRTKERHAELEISLEETIFRLEKNADDARKQYIKAVAENNQSAAKWLELERRTITELTKLHTQMLQTKIAQTITNDQTGALIDAIEMYTRPQGKQ